MAGPGVRSRPMRSGLIGIAIRWIVLAAAFAITSWVLADRFDVSGGALGLLAAAFVYTLVNVLIGPVLRLLTFPLTAMTLGMFSFVVNALLLLIAAWLSDAIEIDGFWTAVLAALILSVISTALHAIFINRDD